MFAPSSCFCCPGWCISRTGSPPFSVWRGWSPQCQAPRTPSTCGPQYLQWRRSLPGRKSSWTLTRTRNAEHGRQPSGGCRCWVRNSKSSSLPPKGPCCLLCQIISNIFRTMKYKFIWGQSELLKTIVGIIFWLLNSNFCNVEKGSEK